MSTTATLRRLLLGELLGYLATGLAIAVVIVIVRIVGVAVIAGVGWTTSLPATVSTTLVITLLVYAVATPATYLKPALAAGATRRSALSAYFQITALAALSTGVVTLLVGLVPIAAIADLLPARMSSAPITVEIIGFDPEPLPASYPLVAALLTAAAMVIGALITVLFLRYHWLVGAVVSAIAIIAFPFALVAGADIGSRRDGWLFVALAAVIVAAGLALTALTRTMPVTQSTPTA